MNLRSPLKYPGPIPYTNGNGSFSGYWDTLSVKWAAERETIVYWDIYLCWTGVVSGAFSVMSERALRGRDHTDGVPDRQTLSRSMKALSKI